jgi:hypothetical protein
MHRTLLACLLIIVSLDFELPAQQPDSQGATLRIARPDTTFTVSFSEEELAELEREPSRLVEFLRERNALCCKPDVISDCVWKCCDGTYRYTCNERLQRLLSLAAARVDEEGR